MTNLAPEQIDQLHALLPETASACVRVIIDEVPEYQRGLDTRLRTNIELAVQDALGAFLTTLSHPESQATTQKVLKGAYRLGQGEATSGRSSEALLTAYRVGARLSWQRFADSLLACGASSKTIADLASQVFFYIDQLSAASLAGHSQALTQRTAEISRRRDQLAVALAAGEPTSTVTALAETAHWKPPATLTALIVDGSPSSALVTLTGERTLWTTGGAGTNIALIPDVAPQRRASLLEAAGDVHVSLGTTTVWTDAAESILRAERAKSLFPGASDAEDVLPALALSADTHVARLLRDRALEPLRDLSPAKQQVQAQTLHSWLLHQGRRDAVAEHLHVHPQTVRYRMTSLREAYGDALLDPDAVLEVLLGLSVALADADFDQQAADKRGRRTP